MELKKLRCSNCDGPLKQGDDGKYYCENCGTGYLMDMDPEDVIYEKFKDLTSNENLTKAAENVNAGATKTFRYVALVIFFLFIVVGILISFFIRSEFKHRVEVERSEASVSSQMAERESEFNEEYDRVSRQIEEQRDDLTGDS